jgi:hypothetical protein
VFTTYKPREGASARVDGERMEKFYDAVAALPGCRGMVRYLYCEVQRPEMATRFETSGQWPAREALIHWLDVERGYLDSVYRARDEVAQAAFGPVDTGCCHLRAN